MADLPSIQRPNGKPYRPRSLRVVGWDVYDTQPETWQVAVLGTHDVTVARQQVRHGFHCTHLVNPTTGWVRLGIDHGEPTWVHDEVCGAACVIFDESDDPPAVREHGLWGCDCPSCLACVGSCRRCGKRDPADGEDVCAVCVAEVEAEINPGRGGQS